MENKLNVVPWYADGLSFACTGCGGCCTGAPGYTWVSSEEIAAIAAYLKLSVAEFSRRYLRRVGGRYSLTELRPHYDCVFLEDRKRCKIYPVRPTQCRTFPFWPENLQSPESWEEAAKRCEGIHPDAPRVPREEIDQQLHS
jgi:Fe-S-cluster containining protein